MCCSVSLTRPQTSLFEEVKVVKLTFVPAGEVLRLEKHQLLKIHGRNKKDVCLQLRISCQWFFFKACKAEELQISVKITHQN